MRYRYFVDPGVNDVWSAKIQGWQRRERVDGRDENLDVSAAKGAFEATPGLEGLEVSTDLRSKYVLFRAEQKRNMALAVALWTQSQAKTHYRPDGVLDHWATLRETLRSNGDDCDGLELLSFNALRELGFPSDEIYRAILFRPSDGQHHMVTLWFESPKDPWVIDPTGAMTIGMPRMSELPNWIPIKLFTEFLEFNVAAEAGQNRVATLIPYRH